MGTECQHGHNTKTNGAQANHDYVSLFSKCRPMIEACRSRGGCSKLLILAGN
jgi:hypothetical protein